MENIYGTVERKEGTKQPGLYKLTIGGSTYSGWESSGIAAIEVGDYVTIDYEVNGKYNNIKLIKKAGGEIIPKKELERRVPDTDLRAKSLELAITWGHAQDIETLLSYAGRIYGWIKGE